MQQTFPVKETTPTHLNFKQILEDVREEPLASWNTVNLNGRD